MLALEELENCAGALPTPEEEYQKKELAGAYIRFLNTLSVTERRVFLRRYWYLESIGEIASGFGFSQSKVKSMLHRTRNKLRQQLGKEGYYEIH